MDSRSHRSTHRGFTLLELVTVMAVVGILMAIAVPSYRYVTSVNRIAAEVNGLLGDMQYARAEAIKEGQTVTVCVSSNGTSCSAGNINWQKGWIVFSDVNGDHTVSNGVDAILRVQSTFTSTDTFTASNAVAYVTFNREGFATGPGIANGALITLHPNPANNDATRCLSVTLVGLMTVQTHNQTNNGVTCL
jgi:type IV fimbrial biogenesis protein FimT